MTQAARPLLSRHPSRAECRGPTDITQQLIAIGGQPDFISRAGGLPVSEFFPTAAIAEAAQKAMVRWGSAALEYGPSEGFPALRQHVAERISRESARVFKSDNVFLTVCAMQGVELIGKVLIDPGDRGSVLDPSGEIRSAMRVNFTRSAPEVQREGVARLAEAILRYLGSNA